MAGNDNVFAAILSGIGMVNQAYQQNQQNQLANKELSFRERESVANRESQKEQFDKTFQQQAEQWNKTYNMEKEKFDADILDRKKANWFLEKQIDQDVISDEETLDRMMADKTWGAKLQGVNRTPTVNQLGFKELNPEVKKLILGYKSDMSKQASDMERTRQDKLINSMIGLNMNIANNQTAAEAKAKAEAEAKAKTSNAFIPKSTKLYFKNTKTTNNKTFWDAVSDPNFTSSEYAGKPLPMNAEDSTTIESFVDEMPYTIFSQKHYDEIGKVPGVRITDSGIEYSGELSPWMKSYMGSLSKVYGPNNKQVYNDIKLRKDSSSRSKYVLGE